jgi:hypothetical protein
VALLKCSPRDWSGDANTGVHIQQRRNSISSIATHLIAYSLFHPTL